MEELWSSSYCAQSSDFLFSSSGPATGVLLEFAIALFLAIGVGMGIAYLGRLTADLSRADDALAITKGALVQHVKRKFADRKLSASEAEVGLFALKGFQVAEIARLRGAASGTVRSQLSQVYAKAGVNSQSMLLALFFDDLIEAPIIP